MASIKRCRHMTAPIHHICQQGMERSLGDAKRVQRVGCFWQMSLCVIQQKPSTGAQGHALTRTLEAKLVEHRHYINANGQDMPEIRNWQWGVSP